MAETEDFREALVFLVVRSLIFISEWGFGGAFSRLPSTRLNSGSLVGFFAMAVNFFGPRLKVERADHHIGQLETIFRDYVRKNLKRLRPERNHRLLKQGRRADPITFPKHTPTILGDAIHNLRASLDHAYHITCDANRAKFDKYRKFPFGKDWQSIKGSIDGHKEKGTTPSDAVISAILDEIQPYVGGKLGLYNLHDLDITDKHLVLIPTLSRMEIDRLEFVDDAGAKTGGGFANLSIMVNQGQGAEFVQTGPRGAILKSNPKDTFKICFGRGQPFEGDEILATIRSMKAATIEALDILERAAN